MWANSQDAQCRDYTDDKVKAIADDARRTRDTVLTMEINLRTYLRSQGYEYQERRDR